MSQKHSLSCACLFLLASIPAAAQSPRTLYTWAGTGNTRNWIKNFGDNLVTLENATAGGLTITETGGAGAGVAISDGFDVIFEGEPGLGGLDLTGLDAVEFDLGHNGTDAVEVQFFVQATPGSTFVALGPNQAVLPGVKTYSAPLAGLSPDQITYIRTIGFNVPDHADQGDLVWTLEEVRSKGTPLKKRDYATHEPGTSDAGFQGAFVNFENAAVEGNDGGQNQTGLRQNTADPPSGNTGSLQWTDLAAIPTGPGPGAAVTWCNGTVYNGNSYFERPTDMSNYAKIVVKMAATNVVEGLVESVGVQYFLQTGAGFTFTVAGKLEQLPADGEYHEISFDLSSIPRLDFVDTHGINLQGHSGGDVIMDIDNIQAVVAEKITDCNENRIPDECDVSKGTSRNCNANSIPDECEVTGGPVTRVLYTWQGTGNTQGWMKAFGDNELQLESSIDGELTVTETGADGKFSALSDDFNIIAEGGTSTGGLDLAGMSTIELELGHNGTGSVNVQFYVQATPDFSYIALGPDVAIAPDVATYSLMIDGLSPAQLTYIRTIGINIREHLGDGNLTWTLREVRAMGTPLSQRDYATHEPGSSDHGLQGATVSFDNLAVQGNDGTQNQSGLSQNTGARPAGNTGSLEWTDIAGQNGGAVAWGNGTVFVVNNVGNTFNERPTDMSGYAEIVVRLAATNKTPGAVESLDVTYFLQTGGFNFQAAGLPQVLPADGEFHEMTFPIDNIPDRRYVDAHGIDLGEHAEGDIILDVDNLRAVARVATPNDCNSNGIPDECEIRDGHLEDVNGNGIPDVCEEIAPRFHRGDADDNGQLQLTDAVRILNVLFLGIGQIPCNDAADADDNGGIQLTDAVRILNVLFLGVGQIPLPGPPPDACGVDPTPVDGGTDLGCALYTRC